MAGDLKRLHAFLDRLRRRARWAVLAELSLVTLALFVTLLLAAAAFGSLGVIHRVLPPVFALATLALPLLHARFKLWPRYSSVRRPRSAARFVDSQNPELHNLALTALELDPAHPSSAGLSSGLVEATVAAAAQRVSSLNLPALWPLSPLKPWATSAGACALLLVLVAMLLPDQLQSGLERFFSPPLPLALPAQLVHPSEAELGPALGDISLTLVYPAYLKRADETIENSSGDILAPRGTLVTLSARGSIQPEHASLHINEDPPIDARIGEHGRFSAQFSVDQPGVYRFALVPDGGGTPIISRPYPITLEEDTVPLVEIIGLEPVTEISPNQVVNFSFQAQDDHGLTRIDLVVEGGKGMVRKTLSAPPAGSDRDEGTLAWYPSEWNIPEGGAVDLWLEAFDDDTISGPKVGRSARYRMTLSSSEKRRSDTLANKEALKEALIGALGDSLILQDEPLRAKTARSYDLEFTQLSEHMLKINTLFATLLKAMEEDTQEEKVVYRATTTLQKDLNSAWDALHEGLAERRRAEVGDSPALSGRDLNARRELLIGRFEQGILSLESFANQQRMEDIMSRGAELKHSGEDLLKMLQEMKQSGTKPDLQALMKRIQEMQQQMSQMAKEMARLDRSSAEWYQNPTGDMDEAKDMMASLENAIREGNIEDATKLLEDYLNKSDELMEALKEMQNQEFKSNREEMTKDMGEVIRGLKDLERQQERLASETKGTREQVMREAGMDPENLNRVAQESLKQVEVMRQSVTRAEQELRAQNAGNLPPLEDHTLQELKGQIQNLEAELQTQDVARALRDTWEAVRDFRRLENALDRAQVHAGRDTQKAQQAAQQGREAAESLGRDLEQLADRMDRSQRRAAGQGQGLAVQQQSLQRKGQGLSEKLKDYAGDSSVVPSSWGERLEQAGQSMESASGKLGGGELAGGEADQRAALQALKELRGEMESTRDEMQRQARGNQPQPGAQQAQGPGQQQGSSGKGRLEDWGNNGLAKGRVDISRDYQAPEAYRREVMEGMKGDAPTRYKRLNRDYYEKLVR